MECVSMRVRKEARVGMQERMRCDDRKLEGVRRDQQRRSFSISSVCGKWYQVKYWCQICSHHLGCEREMVGLIRHHVWRLIESMCSTGRLCPCRRSRDRRRRFSKGQCRSGCLTSGLQICKTRRGCWPRVIFLRDWRQISKFQVGSYWQFLGIWFLIQEYLVFSMFARGRLPWN